MTNKASGNGEESRDSKDSGSLSADEIPIPAELEIDPEAGDLLDPVARWWAPPAPEPEEEDSPKNRKVEPGDEKKVRIKPSPSPGKAALQKGSNDGEAADATEDSPEQKPDSAPASDSATEAKKEKGDAESPGEDENARSESEDDLASIFGEKDGKMDEGELPSDQVPSGKNSEKGAPPVPLVLAGREGSEDDSDSDDVVPEGKREPAEKSSGPDDAGQGAAGDSEKEVDRKNDVGADDDPDEGTRGERAFQGGSEEEGEELLAVSTDGESLLNDGKGKKKKRKAGTKSESAPEPQGGGKTADEEPDEAGSREEGVVAADLPAAGGKEEAPGGEDLGEVNDAGEVKDAGAVPKKRRAGCWTIFATLFFFAVMLVLTIVAVVAGIAWSRLGDVKEEVGRLAEGKLEEQGIYLDYGGWHHQFPRGLVIEEVTLYRNADRDEPVLKASNVGINVNWFGLLRNGDLPETALISFGDSTLTFFHDSEPSGVLESVRGNFLASRETVQIDRLQASLGDLRIVAAGEVILPSPGNGAPSNEAAETSPRESIAASWDFSSLTELAPWFEVAADGPAPVLDLEFSINPVSPEASVASFGLNAREFEWKGVSLRSATVLAELQAEGNRLDFTGFQIGYGDGLLSGVLSYALDTKVLTMERMHSSVDLLALMKEARPEWAEKFKAVTLSDAPVLRFSGTIPMERPDDMALAIQCDHRRGLIYRSETRELAVSNLRGNLELSRGSLVTNDFTASVLGGDVSLNGSTRLAADDHPFSGLVEISGMPLAEVAAYTGNSDLDMAGSVHLEFRGVGYGDVSRIRGGGKLRIEDAKLSSFPVIGPVQETLGQVVPAFAVQGDGHLTCSYLIESGVLLSNDLTVRQNGAKLVTAGSLKLEAKTVDFTTTASLEGSLATATQLEGKSIKVEGWGPVMEPTLVVKEFPLEFTAEQLSEVLGTSTESLEKLRGIIGEDEDVVESLSSQLEEAVGIELGSEVRDLLQGLFQREPVAVERITAQPIEPESEN